MNPTQQPSLSQSAPVQPTVLKKPATKRAIVAFCLSLLGCILPLINQAIATNSYNVTTGTGGAAGWGPAVFIYVVLSVGLIGWPLSVAALITGIIALATKAPRKGLAIASIVIAGVSFIFLPIVLFVVSGVVGQP